MPTVLRVRIVMLEHCAKGRLQQRPNYNQNNLVDVFLHCETTLNVQKGSPLPEHNASRNTMAGVVVV